MTTARPTAPATAPAAQRLLSALLATLVTAAVLWSLGAQADGRHADAVLAQARAAAVAQGCADTAGPAALSRKS